MRQDRLYFTRKVIDCMLQQEGFIKILSEKLMLDEMLCGEANPEEFLKLSLKEAYCEYRKDTRKTRHTCYVELDNKINEQWLEE